MCIVCATGAYVHALNAPAETCALCVLQVLSGFPDTKLSRLLLPEPPLLAGTPYDLRLVTVDRFGNECTQGGCHIAAKLQGPNMPPGQVRSRE